MLSLSVGSWVGGTPKQLSVKKYLLVGGPKFSDPKKLKPFFKNLLRFQTYQSCRKQSDCFLFLGLGAPSRGCVH